MRLSITGIGSISPLAHTPAALAEALEAGHSAIASAPLEGLPPCDAPYVARVMDFDASPYIHPRRARRLDPTSILSVCAARQALETAGIAEGDESLGVLLGTSSAGASPLVRFVSELITVSPEAAPPFEFPNTVANAPASHISIELGLTGPNATLCHGESVIGQALTWGRLWLQDGRCSRLLVGAADEWVPYHQIGYHQVGALRRGHRPRLDDPGMVLGEGATLLAIEPAEAAAERGAKTLATLAGVAIGTTPGEPYRWLPDADALATTIEAALADADLAAKDLGSVVLAANGVPEMEDAELRALRKVVGDASLAATGFKGAVGERGASGALSLAAAALARQRGTLPPFAEGALDYRVGAVAPAREASALPEGATLVLQAGTGGNYAAMVLL